MGQNKLTFTVFLIQQVHKVQSLWHLNYEYEKMSLIKALSQHFWSESFTAILIFKFPIHTPSVCKQLQEASSV